MLTFYEKIAFILLTIITVYLTFKSFGTMIKVINYGQDKLYLDKIITRIKTALIVLISQKTVLKSRPIISFLHSLIAWAFILYMIVNISDVIQGFTTKSLSHQSNIISNLYRLFVDIFSVAAVVATTFFLIRRFIFSSDQLKYHENILPIPIGLIVLHKDFPSVSAIFTP